jgi:hypothetical protein
VITTDLLWLAAQGANISVEMEYNGEILTDDNEYFSPDTCDWQAFQIQNSLRIDITYCSDSVVAQGKDVNGNLVAEQIVFDSDDSDGAAACRLAIIKVAARIGESKTKNMSERELIASWVEDMCQGLDANTIAEAIRNGGNDAMDNFKVSK